MKSLSRSGILFFPEKQTSAITFLISARTSDFLMIYSVAGTEKSLTNERIFLKFKRVKCQLENVFFHDIFYDARFMFLPVCYLPCVHCFSAVQTLITNTDICVIRISEGSSLYQLKQVRFVSVCFLNSNRQDIFQSKLVIQLSWFIVLIFLSFTNSMSREKTNCVAHATNECIITSNCQLYSKFSFVNLCCQESFSGEIAVIILLANGTLGAMFNQFAKQKVL